MSNRAWVTLATNDSYSLGALVLANSLRRAASAHPAVILITPSVTDPMRERLREVFAEVIVVDVMDSKDAAHLALLQRPELGITFTKIHCWNLTQYEKCVFLDADTLVVQNCDELFDRSELSAAPDVGWPDCFNSGVFVFSPSADTFSKLVTFAAERGSFDGGDQGLLNSYFSDWAQGDINKHLPFLYNVTSAAFYSYIPALKHYGQNLKIIHFIGAAKPWLQPYNWQSRSVDAPEHLKDFLQLWWDLFVPQVHSQLDTQMAEVEEAQMALGLEENTEYNEPVQNYGFYEPCIDSSSEFPWHHPDKQIQDSELDVPRIDIHEFHDPWNVYRGNIPPSTDEPMEQKDKYQEVRQYAWDYIYPHEQHFKTDYSKNCEQFPPKSHEETHNQSHNEQRDTWHYSESSHSSQHTQQCTHSDPPQQQYLHQTLNQESLYHHDHYQSHHNQQHDDVQHHHYYPIENNHQHVSEYHDPHHFEQRQQHANTVPETQKDQMHFDSQYHNNLIEISNKNIKYDEPVIYNSMKNHESTYSRFKKQNREAQVYTVMMDHERIHQNHRKAKIHVNGCEFESDSDIDEEINPRHPYDGFYLRHRITIDSRGRKVCIHEIPLLPPSPTPSLESSMEFEDAIDDFLEEINYDRLNGEEIQTGVAGNLARVVPGAPQQQEAVDELTRRQGWEAGNIDYMGADSFDNIWAKISQTLSQPPSSPPRQPSPPKEHPVEEAKEVKEAPVEQVESKPEESTKGTTVTEAPSETPVAAEAPVVASVTVASSEASVSTEATETVASTEAVETAAPAETIECVPSPEATACVSIPEATECVSPPEASDTVAPIEATESVPPSDASETVAPIVAIDSLSPSDATETVKPVEEIKNVSPSQRILSVTPTEATEGISCPETNINVASTEETENVSSPEEIVNVASTESAESVSSPEATVNVAPTEATESVSSKEIVNVVSTETTKSVSCPEVNVNVAPAETAESVSSPEASVTVATTESTDSVSSAEPTVNVAPTEPTESVSPSEAIVSVTSTEATETAAPTEVKETVAQREAPTAAAAPIEQPEPVDIPVPAKEAAESAGKPEDPIPVPVEAAVLAPAEPKEEITPSTDIPVVSVEALKIDDACIPAPQVEPTASETPAPVPETSPALAVGTPVEPCLNLPEATPKQSSDKPEGVSDSPPLASTPAKEEIPLAPAAKTEERRKPAGKLTLQPPAPCDGLPTPDSELEDADALAHAIIAGELRTPTVTSPSPPTLSTPPVSAPLPPRGLSVDQPEVPTPPVETSAVSLSQIGVKSKPTIASQIETSVKSDSTPTSPEASQAPKTPKSDAPKKKIVKKVVKKVVEKEGASSGEVPVPVPPPRKKEKKPKEK